MKSIFLYGSLWLAFSGCSGAAQPAGGADTAVVKKLVPVAVQKTVQKKVFAHLMPWFENKQTNIPAGVWGQHWTMANRNPDIDSAGIRQVAAYYYPLTGPYASGDSAIIAYQLMMMKMSGIDGVFIDWPGTIQLYDYPKNAENTEKIIRQLQKAGLTYAIVYEDQNVNIAFNKGAITNKLDAAQKDMRYMEQHFFSMPNYVKTGGKPLLMVFGPQTFNTPREWTQVFAVFKSPPAFFTLWDHAHRAGNNATGEFAWINADHLVSLQKFYARAGVQKIASAYPAFKAFYADGGWGGPTFTIEPDGLNTFKSTLDLALNSDAEYVQIPTWNDYGEGTVIEPTVNSKYAYLEWLQQRLGVNVSAEVFELINAWYAAKVKYADNPPVQEQLEEIYANLAALRVNEAKALLSGIH
ncbi:glycoside hydrolase family 71/99-like protein [uncultured Chitinophaga sp.]|uniref:glycoside hydrolase family 71/99-like protein n=1 Tax=uncultured Chitinophaga sp. TaxID=339340 RepID=UPI00260068E8|nr:glycoside hydrolase family 71/99-like protein [uncultured Chitinophaga sp.]